ncbi:sensor histidine kinase [Methylobacterium nodulans]|uniref:histidine kinase n=1 Tax=Methylobacterium nodulans (strain LMG 21967 / CNCM I-2342 / ORS 2060) TaxID=460265 RepID=B8IUZ7_METNO|nr:histidine kinase dimerization/phosphoacceptor domain -containing protein [Methylobacterium nodulans]ACL59055.1 signal transduction histidine kinase [Methylobacterium nodulans ORS 2060]
MAADISSPEAAPPTGVSAAFRLFADGAPLLIWRTDPQARCIYVNPAWLAFRGRPVADELGSGWKDGIHPEDRDGHEAVLAAAHADRSSFTAEYRLRRHDGDFRWMLGQGAPLYEGGAFQGYCGSCFDITDRRRAEEHAAHAAVEKEALLAEVYHRVRNNLQVMVSLIGLYGRAAPGECRPAFDALGQRVRAIALVQQHLHEAPAIASIDLAEYLERLGHGLSQMRRAGRIVVDVAVERTALLQPRTANALGMILAEVVAEGLDATPETATCFTSVLIPAGAPEEPIRVRIIASGIGSGLVSAAPPKLGPRLIAAYAGQAEITATGEATPESPLELHLPEPP